MQQPLVVKTPRRTAAATALPWWGSPGHGFWSSAAFLKMLHAVVQQVTDQTQYEAVQTSCHGLRRRCSILLDRADAAAYGAEIQKLDTCQQRCHESEGLEDFRGPLLTQRSAFSSSSRGFFGVSCSIKNRFSGVTAPQPPLRVNTTSWSPRTWIENAFDCRRLSACRWCTCLLLVKNAEQGGMDGANSWTG